MSTTRAIAHNTLIQITGKILSTLLGLIAIGLMGRYLTTEKFGWYITTITFLQFVGIIIDFGLIPVTAQMMSEPQFDKQKLFKNLLGFRLLTAIIFLGLAPLAAWFFPYELEIKKAIALSTISFLAIALNQIFTGFYQTRLKMHVQVIGENISRIVLIVCLWLLIIKQASFLPIMGALILSNVTYTMVMWFGASREIRVGFAYSKEIWFSILKKSWPIAISIIFNVIYLRGDIILLSLFRSQVEVGIYGAAYRVIDILGQTAMMVMGVILPLLAFTWSRNLKDEFRLRYQQAFDTLMFIAAPLAVGTLILSRPLISFIFSDKYLPAAGALQILIIAVFGVYLGAVFGHTAVAVNRQKQTMWIYISDAILTLIGYLIFIPKYGMYGAAWMTVFSEFYAGVLLWLALRHYTQEKLRLKTFGKIILSCFLMSAVLLTLQQLHVILLVIIAAAVYGVSVFLTRAVSKETMKEIMKLKN